MPDLRLRTLAACALPALAVSVAWLRIEQPSEIGEAAVVVALALVPALVSERRAACARRDRRGASRGVDRLRRPALGATSVSRRAGRAADRRRRRPRPRRLLPRRLALLSGGGSGDARARPHGDLRLRPRRFASRSEREAGGSRCRHRCRRRLAGHAARGRADRGHGRAGSRGGPVHSAHPPRAFQPGRSWRELRRPSWSWRAPPGRPRRLPSPARPP